MASLARLAARNVRGLLQAAQESQVARAAQQGGRQSRGFAAGGGHDSVTHEGLTLHKPARWHVVTGQAFAATMWFWVFYRLYNDWDTFIYGHAAHLDHELEHSHEEHGKSEGHH